MIRIGIAGYGNLGRGVESAIRQNEDMELCAVFTRRDPASLKINTPGVPVCPPEGDAGTGMVATNAVKVRTGNVSAGTSAFAMVVRIASTSK